MLNDMSSLPIDDHHAPLYTVGQVSSMLDVQPAFLRRLDTENLVCPERSGGGQRRYTRAEIGLVQRVNQLAGEGLTLAGIKRLLVLEAEVERLRAEVRRLQTESGPVPEPQA
ncbi:MAG TPA: MerR family transcriptional regulator [Acidimicrobiales bacterium]|nr:MerR family transcriptional regulator [Acidimicrobiales bacterium]